MIVKLHLNIIYEIGDILFLEQTNGGGILKVCIIDIEVSLRHMLVTIRVDKTTIINSLKGIWQTKTSILHERDITRTLKYWRRGDTWIIPIPKKVRVMGINYLENKNG